MENKERVITEVLFDKEKFFEEYCRIHVVATFNDGSMKEIFSYYPDEINFSQLELAGLTEKEACNLYTKKDIAYLQS